MRPVAWSSSYLFRWPFGISTVTSNCTAVSVAHGGPAPTGGGLDGGGHHSVEWFDLDPVGGGSGGPGRGTDSAGCLVGAVAGGPGGRRFRRSGHRVRCLHHR